MRIPFAVAMLCFGVSVRAQGPLRLCGSTTVQGVLELRHAELEKAVGRTIEFSGTGTNAGLISLLSGDSDVAMMSSPLDETADAINHRSPGRVRIDGLHATRIGEVRTLFIVNPRNRVRSLSATQLSDVLTGGITNWKDVGGADATIVVVSLLNGGPLLEHLLHNVPITAQARGVPNATQIPMLVAQEPNAIGIISAAHPRGQTSVIQTDALVEAPLFLVTKGEPTGVTLKLVETAKLMLRRSG